MGEVFLVDGDGQVVRTLQSPNRAEAADGLDASQFGAGLAAANGRLFVVAAGKQPPAWYVINVRSGRAIRHLPLAITAPNPAVAVRRRRVVIGSDTGVVLVVDWPTGTVLQTLRSPGGGNQFGWAVAVERITSDVDKGYFGDSLTVTGSELAVGAWGYDEEGVVALYDWTAAAP